MSDSINQSSGITRSYWSPQSRERRYEPLTRDIRCDVAIIGAGMAGLSVAYSLSKLGKSVAVLEDGLIGSGETSRTSAHLSSYPDGRLANLETLFGLESAKLAVESHAHAIDAIEKIVGDEKIACDFKRVDGYLIGGKKNSTLMDEAKTLELIGAHSIDWVGKAPWKQFDTGRCLKFQRQAIFHPMKYLNSLADAIVRRGGQIYEATHVAGIEDSAPCTLTTAQGVCVQAEHVLVATNSPINNRLNLQTKLAQYRTYVIGISIPKGQLEDALYWDTDDPYHYIRVVPSPDEDRDYVLIGGEDHKVGQSKAPKQAFSDLKKWAAARFLDQRFVFQWSGQVIEPVDGLAFIGRNPGDKHVFVNTGTSGSGLTYGAIAGFLVPDLIMGKKSPYEALYDPSRTTLKAAGTFMREACNMAAQYADWVKLQKFSSKNILPHEGAVVRRGLALEAVYRDYQGDIHRMSAICPHLGGVVRWNSLEKTWDCPCHGSRFTSNGEVINGPANCGLKKVK